jgi:hypothetical protein
LAAGVHVCNALPVDEIGSLPAADECHSCFVGAEGSSASQCGTFCMPILQ